MDTTPITMPTDMLIAPLESTLNTKPNAVTCADTHPK